MSERRHNSQENRHYIVTRVWTGMWEGCCDRCGAERHGSLTDVFALFWKHRKCDGGDGDEWLPVDCG